MVNYVKKSNSPFITQFYILLPTDNWLNNIMTRTGCVQTLVKWGCSLETVTLVTGDTPLHLAAAQGHLNVVKYIVSIVEDWMRTLASINNDAETPLDKSIVNEQHAVVDYLSNLKVGG